MDRNCLEAMGGVDEGSRELLISTNEGDSHNVLVAIRGIAFIVSTAYFS
jgi:hypothetical protein